MDPYGSSRQSLWSRSKLASSIVTDVWSLCCLLPVWSLISTLVCHTAHCGGMGHDNSLTMLGHGVISGHTLNAVLSGSADIRSAWSYPCHRLPCQWARIEEKEDPTSLKDFLCLWFSSFLPSVIPALPWPIKGKAENPTKGIDSRHHASHHA